MKIQSLKTTHKVQECCETKSPSVAAAWLQLSSPSPPASLSCLIADANIQRPLPPRRHRAPMPNGHRRPLAHPLGELHPACRRIASAFSPFCLCARVFRLPSSRTSWRMENIRSVSQMTVASARSHSSDPYSVAPQNSFGSCKLGGPIPEPI
jgi:hypothetical protein